MLSTIFNQSFGQASWHFSIWFNLYDKSGNAINQNDYLVRDVKLYTLPFETHSDNHLVYDTLHHSFKFSQHTAVSTSKLVFVLDADTTILNVSTTNTYITNVELKSGTYTLNVLGDKENFEYKPIGKSQIIACFNKYGFNQNKTTETKKTNIKDLIGVKLE